MLRIAMDAGVVEYNHAKLSDHASQVPAGDRINEVHGDGAEPGTLDFLLRLEKSIGMVADHTDVIRSTVHQHAEALREAAADLEETDRTAADDTRSYTDIVDETVQDTSADDVERSDRFLREQQAAQSEADPSGETPGMPGQTTPASTPGGAAVPDADPSSGL